jgi:hypothetical protein
MPMTPNKSFIFGTLCLGLVFLSGCDTFDNVPRGTKSLLDVVRTNTTPTQAAEMATDPYSAENRFKGTTLLSNADFGGSEVYLELYLDGVDDTDQGVRSAAIRALGRHGDPQHVGLIVNALSDENRLVRIEAARALQRVHSPDAVSPLINSLNLENEADADVRSAVADALGQYHENRVVQSLISALRDPRLVVNNRVQKSLQTLTGQNFGLDRRMWMDWYNETENLFAAAQVYTYPAFHRKKRIIEHLPFVSPPPNETSSTPVGLDPVVDG